MSRIGKQPVIVPKGVDFQNDQDGNVRVKGPKGELSFVFSGLKIEKTNETIVVLPFDSSRLSRQKHGLYRTLISNMIVGVTQGFEKTLIITGVGYRADLSGKTLTMSLGYSHPVVYEIPADVEIAVEAQTRIKLRSANKQLLGETAAKIRSFKPPDPYKAKGIRYETEEVRRKVGKSA